MPTLGEAIVNVRADNSKLKSGLRDSERATRRSTRKMSGYFKNVQNNLNRIGSQLNNIGRQLTRSGGIGLVGLGAVMTGLVKPAANLQEELANVNTLFSQTAFNADQYRQAILEMSKQVPKSTKTLTEGLYQIKSAGIDAGNTLNFLKVASVAATAGVTDVETTVNALTKTLAAYGEEGDQVLKTSNKLFKAVELGNIRFGQLAEILPQATAMAASAGMSMDELFGTIATGVRTLKPEQVATGLARMITGLEKASDEQQRLAETMGFEFTIEAFREKGIVSFLKDMREGLEDTDVSYREFFRRTQSARLANALLNESFDDLSKNIEGVSDSTGAINTAFEKQVKVLNNQATLAWNNIIALVKNVGNEMLPSITDMVKSVRGFANALDEVFSQKTDEAKQNIGEAIVRIGKFAGAMLGLVTVAGLLSMGLGLIVNAGALVAGVFALLMNPIVLLGLAMFTLYTAWKNNWFGIRDKTKEAYDKIKPMLDTLWNILQRAWDWTIKLGKNIINWILNTTWAEKWQDIKDLITGAWKWAVNIASDVKDYLLDTKIGKKAQKFWKSFKDLITSGWKFTLNLGETAKKWFEDKDVLGKGKQTIKAGIEWTGETFNQLKEGDLTNVLGLTEKALKLAIGLKLAAGATTAIGGAITSALSGAAGFTGGLMGFPALLLGIEVAQAFNKNDVSGIAEMLLFGLVGAIPGAVIGGVPGATIGLSIGFMLSDSKIFSWANRNVGQNRFGIGDNKKSGQNVTSNPLYTVWKWLRSGNDKNTDVQSYWKEQGIIPPYMREGLSNGAILGGYGGGDTIPAMLEKGEAVVPKEAVAGGIPGITSWFKSKAQGFSNGLMPKISNAKDFLGTASGDLQGTASNIMKVMSSVFDELFDSLLKLADKRFPDLADDIELLRKEYKKTMDSLGLGKEDDTEEKKKKKEEKEQTKGMWEAFKNTQLFKEPIKTMTNQLKSLGNSIVSGTKSGFMNLVNRTELSKVTQPIQRARTDENFSAGGAIVQIITSILSQTKAFQKIIKFVSKGFSLLAQILNPVVSALMPAFKDIMAVVVTLMKVLQPVLVGIANVISWVISKIIGFWNGLMKALDGAFGWLTNAFEKMIVDTDKTTDEINEMGDETNDVNESLRNLPQTFKVATAQFVSAQGYSPPSAAVGGTVRSSGIAEVHKGEIIANKSQQQAMKQKTTIEINGDVYGWSDFQSKVNQARDMEMKRRGNSSNGLGRV